MTQTTTHRCGSLLAVLLTTLAVLAVFSAGAGSAAAQTAGNASAASTINTASDTGAAGCRPDGPPPIERTRLQLEDNQIAAGDPGKIAFQHELKTYYECPVTVIATIYAPDGVELKMSSGGTISQVEGAAQATYRIDPTTGGTLDSSAIKVYYDGPVDGTKQVDIDATAKMFPVDHRSDPALYTEIGGQSESLVVTEQVPPTTPTPESPDIATSTSETPETTTSTPGDKPDQPLPQTPVGMLALIFVVLVSLVAVVGAAQG